MIYSTGIETRPAAHGGSELEYARHNTHLDPLPIHWFRQAAHSLFMHRFPGPRVFLAGHSKCTVLVSLWQIWHVSSSTMHPTSVPPAEDIEVHFTQLTRPVANAADSCVYLTPVCTHAETLHYAAHAYTSILPVHATTAAPCDDCTSNASADAGANDTGDGCTSSDTSVVERYTLPVATIWPALVTHALPSISSGAATPVNAVPVTRVVFIARHAVSAHA